MRIGDLKYGAMGSHIAECAFGFYEEGTEGFSHGDGRDGAEHFHTKTWVNDGRSTSRVVGR
jgi:hypothetical protein